ncbi:cation diffusion facilitator family transporter [bacterium]|nr:cation diffusion facilitator family transporter [bacterium]
MEKTEKVSFISSLFHLFLVGFKFSAALLSGSIALRADAIHSVTDFLSSFGVFVGLKISKRKPKKFPYGLHKVENLISLVVSLLIFWAGYEIIKEVLFFPQAGIKRLYLALLVSGVSFGISLALSVYKIKAGKKTNSPSLLADGHHSRTDAFSSLIVFLGLSAHFIGLHIEKITAAAVVLFVAKSGYEILVNSLKVLLDASVDYSTLNQIRKTIEKEKNVENIETLIGRNSGRYRFIEADLSLKVKDIQKAHKIVDSLEKNIKKNIPFIDEIRIHYEPVKKTTWTYVVPLDSSKEKLSEHFGEAPYFVLIRVDHRNNQVVKKEIISNPFIHKERGKGIAVAEDLVHRDIDYLVVKESLKGKGPQYVLEDYSVETWNTDKNNLQDVLKDLNIKEDISF